jgi:hypothetical protein
VDADRIFMQTPNREKEPWLTPTGCPTAMLTSIFTQPILASYKRVNKVGNRNLRCFPDHSPSGHCESGFCGQPVILHLPGASLSPATYVGEFTLKDAPALLNGRFEPGEDCFFGECLDDMVMFNRECDGWRYGWASTRHTAGQLHVFRVNILMDGELVRAVDSSSFTISGMRNQVVNEALRTLPPSDPLRLILRAIHERVQEDSIDLDFGNFADWDGVSADDAMSLMDDQNEGRLLAMERLDALLDRVATFVIDNFHAWRTLHALNADLNEHLFQTEGRGTGAVASEIRELLGMRLECPPPAARLDSSEVLFRSALAFAQSGLPPGTAICPGFILGGSNDVSGCYRLPKALFSYSNDLRLRLGWLPLDLSIWSSCLEPHVFSKVLGPHEISMWFSSKTGMHKSMLLKLCVLRACLLFRARLTL